VQDTADQQKTITVPNPNNNKVDPTPTTETTTPVAPVEEKAKDDGSQTITTNNETGKKDTTTVTKEEEASRDTIVVKNVIEVYATTEEAAAAVQKEENNSLMMVLIPSIVVAVLLIAAVTMVARVCMNKKKAENETAHQAVEKVKEEACDVEPQFILAPDDSKDIFGRSSHAPLAAANDAIEESEQKTGRGDAKNKKRKGKKIVLRKKKVNEADAIEEEEKEVYDDGFNNHADWNSPGRSGSLNSSSKGFFQSGSSVRGSIETAQKLKSLELHNCDEE